MLLSLITLSGCNRTGRPWAAYLHQRDAIAAYVPVLALFDIYPCARVEERGQEAIIGSVPLDQCVRMQPARRMRGIWLDEFEDSRFFEDVRGPAKVRAIIAAEHDVWPRGEWIDLAWPQYNELHDDQQSNSRMFLIDLVGRRTAFSGHYGHMGGSRTEVLVDRIISAREIYRSQYPYLENELPH